MSNDLIIQLVAYVIMFLCFTARLDKRISLLEMQINNLVDKQEKYNNLQARVLTNELHIREFNEQIKELRKCR